MPLPKNLLRFVTCNHPQRADITQNPLRYRSIVLIIHFLILWAAIQARIKGAAKFVREAALCHFISFSGTSFKTKKNALNLLFLSQPLYNAVWDNWVFICSQIHLILRQMFEWLYGEMRQRKTNQELWLSASWLGTRNHWHSQRVQWVWPTIPQHNSTLYTVH